MYFLAKYSEIIAQNFTPANTSSVIWNKKSHLNFRLHSAGIENFTPMPSQFLYLLLLTKRMPFLAKKYKSKKKYRFGSIRADTVKLAVYANQAQQTYIIHDFMTDLLKEQLAPENSAVLLEKNYTKFVIWNAPLDFKTYCLQTSGTAFLEDIHVYIKIITKNNLLSEIAFWCFFYNFLRNKDITSMWYLSVRYYLYDRDEFDF